MTIHVFRSLKTIAKRFAVLAVTVAMLFSLGQTSVLAVSSSNFDNEPIEVPGITEPVAGKNLSEMREQRREWQSKASALHDGDKNDPKSLGEAVNEKLNLDEITEGYDPQRESEKAHQRDPLGAR